MMLSSMNVTVIPFLLEAFMSVENVTEWVFGPEYVFQFNKSTIVDMDAFITENITGMVHCRPKVSHKNVLFCRSHNTTFTTITKLKKNLHSNTVNIIKPLTSQKSNKISDQLFEIEFSKEGVRNFKVMENRARNKEPLYNYSITDIIEQFNIGTDLSIVTKGDSMKNYENVTNGSYHVINHFEQNDEHTPRASKCDTKWEIIYIPSNHHQYNKGRQFLVPKNKKKFQLSFLPISYTNPIGKIFSIDRFRMTCTQLQYIMFLQEKWNICEMVQYFHKMKISDKKPKFTSHTHLQGYVLFPTSLFKYYFSENVDLHLLRIRPVRNSYSYYDMEKPE